MAWKSVRGTGSGDPIVSAHISVRGVVQGVGFRWFIIIAAEQLGINGFVRNCPDGSVEILAEGGGEVVRQLIAIARDGPPSAEVDEVTFTWNDAPKGYTSFERH